MKKLSFTDRLTDFLQTASESELHVAASQIALAVRIRFGTPPQAKAERKRKKRAVAAGALQEHEQ